MELTKGGLLKICIFAIKTTNLYGTIPVVWNPGRQKVQEVSETKLSQLKWRHAFTSIYLAAGAIQVVWKWGEADPFVKAFGGSLIATIITTVPPSYIALTQPTKISEMLNSMICLEQLREPEISSLDPRASTTFGGKCVKYSCTMMSLALTYVQVIFCGVVIMNPCFPTFTGYWLAPQCRENLGLLSTNNWTLEEIMMRCIIACMGFYAWVAVVPPTGLLTCLAILKGFCVCSYIQCCASQLSDSSEIVTTLTIKKTATMLREIQIILLHFREIYCNIILVPFACGGILSQILFLYTTIDLYRSGLADTQPIWLVACAWGGITYVVAILMLYGNLAKVYENSEGFNADVKRNEIVMRNKWFRRHLVSCPIMRVYLGAYNFIDKGTSTSMEEFVVDQLISLLLLEE